MSGWKPVRPVLMTADPIGGVWTYALELCAELGLLGVEVVLATMGRRLTAAERAAAGELENVRLFESGYRLEWMEAPWNDVAAAGDWLLEIAARTGPAIVHLNGYAYGAIRWRVPCLIVGHSCVFSWFEAVHGASPPDSFGRYRANVIAGLRGADRVTAPSGAMLAALRRHYGPFAAAAPIYNGRSAARFAAGRARAVKEPFVITAGRLWDRGKNVEALAAAAGVIPWPVYAAGEHASPGGGAVHLKGLTVLGRLDSVDLARWLGRAAIFALPARYEPFGLSILEAALAGCALLLGDIPSLRELWRDAALFVSPNHTDEIATGLRRLIDQPTLRGELAMRARRRAETFSSERMAQGYLALYEQLFSARGRPIAEDLAAKTDG